MEIDKEKLQQVQLIIDNLANGINPIDGTALNNIDVFNNVHIIRSFFYASQVLQGLIDGVITTPKKIPNAKKSTFHLNDNDILNFEFSKTPIPLSTMVEMMNRYVDEEQVKKLSFSKLAGWLIKIGILTIDEAAKKVPTEIGEKKGLTIENRVGSSGKPYSVVLYNESAQRFIIDNIEGLYDFLNVNS